MKSLPRGGIPSVRKPADQGAGGRCWARRRALPGGAEAPGPRMETRHAGAPHGQRSGGRLPGNMSHVFLRYESPAPETQLFVEFLC